MIFKDAFWLGVASICTTLTSLILITCVHRLTSTWNDMMHEMRMSRLGSVEGISVHDPREQEIRR